MRKSIRIRIFLRRHHGKFWVILILLAAFLISVPVSFHFAANRFVKSAFGKNASFKTMNTDFFSYIIIKDIRSGEQTCRKFSISYNIFELFRPHPYIKSVIFEEARLTAEKIDNHWTLPGFREIKMNEQGTIELTPFINRLVLKNCSFQMKPFGSIEQINYTWKENRDNDYAGIIKGTGKWEGIDGPVAIQGIVNVADDFSRIRVESLTVNSKNHNAEFRGFFTPDSTESFIIGSGSVLLPGFFSFLLPIAEIPLPVSGPASATFRMDDPLGKRHVFFTAETEDGLWDGYSQISFQGGANILGHELRLDSVRIKNKLGGAFARGTINLKSQEVRIRGSLKSINLLPRAKHKALNVLADFHYSGTASDVQNGKVTADGYLLRTVKADEKRVCGIRLNYNRKAFTISAEGPEIETRGKGTFIDTLEVKGSADIPKISRLLARWGLHTSGSGQVQWGMKTYRDQVQLSAFVDASDITVMDFYFDTLTGTIRYSDGILTAEPVYARNGPFRFHGSWEKTAGADKAAVTFSSFSDGSEGSFDLTLNNKISGSFQVNGMELNRVRSVYRKFPEAEGRFSCNIRVDGEKKPQLLTGNFDWSDPRYKQLKTEHVKGTFTWENASLLIDSLIVWNRSKRSTIMGRIPYPVTDHSPEKSAIDISANLKCFPIEIFTLIYKNTDALKGDLNGSIQITGDMNDLSANGSLTTGLLTLRPHASAPVFVLENPVLQANGTSWEFVSEGRMGPVGITLNGTGGFIYQGETDIKADITFRKGGTGNISLLREQEDLSIHTSLRDVPLRLVESLYDSLPEMDGLVSMDMDWRNRNAAGSFRIKDPFFLAFTGDSMNGEFRIKEDRITVSPVIAYAAEGMLTGEGTVFLNPEMKADFHLSAINFPVKNPYITTELNGSAGLKISEKGAVLNAALIARNLLYPIPACDQKIIVPAGPFKIKENHLQFQNWRGTIEDAPVTADGSIIFGKGRKWKMNFKGRGDSVLFTRYKEFEALSSRTDFNITIAQDGSDIRLKFLVPKGKYYKNIPITSLMLPGRGVFNPTQFRESQRTKLHILFSSSESLYVENNLATARFGADVTVDGTMASPIWQGRIRTYEGELYLGKDILKPFKLEKDQGTINFDRVEPGFNPSVYLTAYDTVDYYPDINSSEREEVVIKMTIDGPLRKLKSVTFSSPTYPEWNDMEILSVLTTGQSNAMNLLSQPGSQATQTQARNMFQYFVLQRQTRQLAKFLHVDQLRIRGDITKIVQNDNAELAYEDIPEVSVVKTVTPKLNIEYSSKIGEQTLQSNEVRLQYLLRKNLYLESASNLDNNHGMDLKYKVRF